jgi:hypothetical protein
MSAWTAQPDLPIAAYRTRVLYHDGYVYVVGGGLAGSADNTTMWYGAIDTNGNIASWTTTTPPFQVNTQAMYGGAVSGKLIVGGGINTSAVASAKWWAGTPSTVDGSVQWIPLPDAPLAAGLGISAVIGDTLVWGGGDNGGVAQAGMYSVSVSATGDVGPFQIQTALPIGLWEDSATFVGQTLFYIGGNALQTSFFRVPYISVPLRVTGLGAGTYDIVIQLADAPDANNSIGLTISNGAIGASYPNVMTTAQDDGVWTANAISTGLYIPITVYGQGTSSRPIHIIEDTANTQPKKHAWISYDSAGKPVQYAESTLNSINLLSENSSIFGGIVPGTPWASHLNCTPSLQQVAYPPLGPKAIQNIGAPLFPAYNIQQMKWSQKLSSTAAGAVTIWSPIGAAGIPVVPTMSYTAFAFGITAVTARSVFVGIAWYDKTGAQITISYGSGVTENVIGTLPWVQPFSTAAAPSNAVTAAVVYDILTPGGAAEIHYMHCASFAVTSAFPLVFFMPHSGPGTLGEARTLSYNVDGSLASIT